MLEETKAWIAFSKTGRVEDYLIYADTKRHWPGREREVDDHADPYRWTGFVGTEYRGT